MGRAGSISYYPSCLLCINLPDSAKTGQKAGFEAQNFVARPFNRPWDSLLVTHQFV